MSNLSDIARLAGVSVSTVSRSLHHDNRISDETLKRVLDAARSVGYTKHMQKASPFSQEYRCLGLIIPEVLSGYYSRLVHLVVESFAEHGYDVAIRLTNFDNGAILKQIYGLCASNVDCLLIVADDSEEVSDDIFSAVSTLKIPSFFITANYIPNNDFDSLYIDEVRGISMMIDYLAQKGYERIGFVGDMHTLARKDVYLDSLSNINLPAIDDFVKISSIRAEPGGYHAMCEILAGNEKPDAVFFGYDQMAIGALKAIREAGLSVPGDIAVASFDDIILSEFVDNGLTTVQSPCEEMVSIATRVLLSRINDESAAPQQIALKPRLVIRGTA